MLIVSNRPLHGELKLRGVASEFYQNQVNRHLEVRVQAINIVRELPTERLRNYGVSMKVRRDQFIQNQRFVLTFTSPRAVESEHAPAGRH